MTRKILVPVDFSPSSDAALEYALTVADQSGAEVEMLHVWTPRARGADGTTEIFADTPEGVAMERRLTAAESDHPARISGRLEFGDEPSNVILDILERERFDLVVMGRAQEGGHVTESVEKIAPCRVVTTPPPAPAGDEDETEAA